jgi:NodT family efflux transporter outer membrane factor (OMF) lipoprotein
MKKTICLLTTAALLSSCGVYNKYKPATSVPENLYGEIEATVDADNHLGTLSWREVFADPQLQALIEQALENNTDLKTAELRVKESEAALKAAKLAYFPSFALAPQGTVSSFDKAKATQTYSLPITASWQYGLGNRITNAKRQAKALTQQMKDVEQSVRSQLIAGVANTYYTLLMLDEQVRIAESTEQTWKESLESTRAMMQAGMVTEAAVSQTEAAYYSVRTSVLDLKEQRHQVENALALILAETPHDIARGSWDNQQLPTEFSVGVPLQMLSNRPDVRAAEQAVAQAFYGVSQARGSFYPTITLSGSAGWTNSAGTAIINPGKLLATAVGSLTQPIFAKGQNSANLRIAKAQLEESKLAFQQTLLSAGSEVNDLLSQYQTAQNKASEYENQVAALRRAVESTELLMKHGNTTYLEVLTARQSLLSSELTQVANRFTEIQSLINLYQALGGGQE